MGEAKRKQQQQPAAQNNTAVRRERLEVLFKELAIEFDEPGFYDHRNFVGEETKDRLFTERYAEWVLLRERDQDYDLRVQTVVPRLADIMHNRIRKENWFGACIAVTAIMTRALDRLGIWNIPVRGSASAYAAGQSRHFAIVDQEEGHGFDTGHMWIIAPPYDVVDVSLHYQRWQGDRFQHHIPQVIIGKDLPVVKARVQDVVAPDIRAIYPRDSDLHYKLFHDQRRVLEQFPARQYAKGPIDIRYVPAGIVLPDEPLERVNEDARSGGVSGSRFWTEDIAPILGSLRHPACTV